MVLDDLFSWFGKASVQKPFFVVVSSLEEGLRGLNCLILKPGGGGFGTEA